MDWDDVAETFLGVFLALTAAYLIIRPTVSRCVRALEAVNRPE